jgi:hypothetical protein
LADADSNNVSQIAQERETGAFLAICVAPIAAISASYKLRRFFAINACYIKSQFPMMLMIVYSINANDNILLLA